MSRKILIVEDDTSFGVMLKSWATRNGFEPTHVSGMEQAREQIEQHTFDLVLTDLRLPDGDGIMLLTWIRERKSPPPVIVMTSYAEVHSAVSAIKLGAFDFLEKPVNPTLLKEKIDQALGNGSCTPEPAPAPKGKPAAASEGVVHGESHVARRMYEHIKIVAPTHLSVLITGESGTGKEYAARMIHATSKRRKAPFLAVDCGSLSRELAPSELFGHLKGSFTSAIADKKGVFELADGGTIFLDEVGNLPYEVQVQLLRTLQELKIRPVGSPTDIKVDVRIIVATNENLETAIAEGRFREDLYHRLNEFSITVPPLRERMGDIPMFAGHFIETANEELDKQVKGFTDEALKILQRHSWSGNLRELRNVVRRAVLFAPSDVVTADNLPNYLLAPPAESAADMTLHPGDERGQIENALRVTRGNKAAAAKLLGIDRKTLYNKMHLYDMEL